MRHVITLSLITLSLSCILFASHPASAQTPAFIKAELDLHTAKQNVAGQRTQIMTLASIHLSGHKHLRPEMMDLLLKRLEHFHPTIITHEGLSGLECDILKNYPAAYSDTFDTYCWDRDAAQKITGLNVDAAAAQADKMLEHWSSAPTPSDRRKLALLFLAANDRPSAQVQWLRLPVTERIKADGIDDALFTILDRKPKSMNESYDIAVALAVHLGLERVYAVDDHTADSSALPIPQEEYGKALSRNANKPAAQRYYDAQNKKIAAIQSAQDMLTYYQHINGPKALRAGVNFDFLAAIKSETPPLYGRMYAAWWETRNLRMVSNIRATSVRYPGARILNIVGASHKGYYDAYLNMMHDVQVVDVRPYLK